ncbi:MFS transporter [Candidatus Peregrinibacteria bacterium]|nr:MFS transporter [Candidatus Peregrinibacteria bacterium]
MQTRKNVILWVLYDFANSIVDIVFFLYFAQWIVVDSNVPDFYFNLTFTVCAFLLLLTVPLSGAILDTRLRRITGLRYATASTVLFYGLCALQAVNGNKWSALLFFTVGLYSYLLSFTFYTPLINDISKPSQRGLVSGLGITANYLGQFVGLVIALPFANGSLHFFGANPRAETLLPSVIIFCLLALPMLFGFQEPMKKNTGLSLYREIKNVWTATRALIALPTLTLFFASYFLFNDAILTVSDNFPIFLERVWHIPDTIKTYLLLVILLTCAAGGTISGYIADRAGHKRTLFILLTGWIILLPILAFITSFPIFVIATTLMGFWFGASWTVSRSVMSYLAPHGKHNLAFAYFGLAERASSFVGPMVWGFVVTYYEPIGSDRYRWAILAVTVFIILGSLALIPVRSDRKPDKKPS